MVALLGFVLPWITVSCQGRVLAQVSGLDLAIGRMTIHNPFTDVTQVHAGSPDLPVALALVLILAGLALSFRHGAWHSALVNAGSCAAALLLIAYEVLVLAGSAIRSQAAASHATDGLERSFADGIHVGTGFGFWLTCAALAAAAFLYWTLRVGRGPAPSRTRPAPSPAPPAARIDEAPGKPPG